MRILLILSTMLVVTWSGCQNNELPSYSVITPQEMETLRKEQADLILIDVRTPQEVAAGKIDGAIEIDFHSPDFQAQLDGLDREKPYGVYCKKGARSAGAMKVMQELGFSKVYDMEGGYDAWIQLSNTE